MSIVREGAVDVSRGGRPIAELSRGDFIGDLHGINQNLSSRYTYTTRTGTSLFSIPRDQMADFAAQNPGLIMKLAHDYA